MAQGRFIAKLMLSCACAKCTSLGSSAFAGQSMVLTRTRRTRMTARAPRRVSVALMKDVLSRS